MGDDGVTYICIILRTRLTLVVVLALEGQCVSLGVFLPLLISKVCVSVMVAQSWAIFVALSAY